MLTISKKSWHYRIMTPAMRSEVDFKARHNELSLCWYFWNVAVSILLCIFFTVAGIFAIAGLCWVGFHLGYVWYFLVSYLGFDGSGFDEKLLWTSLAWNCIIVFCYFCYCIYQTGKMAYNGIMKKTKEEMNKPNPNILVEYYKARKDKYCPMMRIED